MIQWEPPLALLTSRVPKAPLVGKAPPAFPFCQPLPSGTPALSPSVPQEPVGRPRGRGFFLDCTWCGESKAALAIEQALGPHKVYCHACWSYWAETRAGRAFVAQCPNVRREGLPPKVARHPTLRAAPRDPAASPPPSVVPPKAARTPAEAFIDAHFGALVRVRGEDQRAERAVGSAPVVLPLWSILAAQPAGWPPGS